MRSPEVPPRGARPPGGEATRRSLLLLGGLGASGFLVGRMAGDAATAAPPQPSTGGHGLPDRPTPPAPGTPAREPYGSGALGDWRRSGRESSTPTVDAAAAAGDGLHLAGDSLGSRLLPVLRDRFSDRPFSYDVWNGRPTAPTLERLARLADERRLAPTLVLAAGSNDVFDPWSFEEQVHRAREIVGRRRLLWITTYVSRPRAPSADLRNCAVLLLSLERAAAAGHVELVPWFSYLARVGPRIEEYVEDGVHPTPRGVQALADLVLATLG